MGARKLWQIVQQKLLPSKALVNSICLLSLIYLCMSQDNVWMAKFGEPPVIHQIHQGYPPPKVYAIQYISLIYIIVTNNSHEIC